MTLPFEHRAEEATVLPDGRQILCAVREPKSDVWVIEDFDEP
jgi:hypothetical protein